MKVSHFLLLIVILFQGNATCNEKDPGLNLATMIEEKKENEVTNSLREAIKQSNLLYGKAFMAGDSSLFY